MSVTGHRDVRQQDDHYETPAWCVRALLPYLTPGPVLDPCCGNGAIGRVLAEEWPRQYRYGVEIDEGRANEARAAQISQADGTPLRLFDTVSHADYLAGTFGVGYEKAGTLIVTNPPFKLALEFAKKAIESAETVALLLRINWLASATRRPFHRAHPADLVVLPNRPSFAQFCSCTDCGWKETFSPTAARPDRCPRCVAAGFSAERGAIKVSTTDSTEYAWFIWGPGRGHRYCIATEDGTPAVDWSRVRTDIFAADAAIERVEKASS